MRLTSPVRLPAGVVLPALLLFAGGGAGDEPAERLKVGVQPDGRIVVPTNQILQPAGVQVTFPGRPVDLLVIEGGRLLVAKNMRDLVFIDPVSTGLSWAETAAAELFHGLDEDTVGRGVHPGLRGQGRAENVAGVRGGRELRHHPGGVALQPTADPAG